jgi:hypothetical protein
MMTDHGVRTVEQSMQSLRRGKTTIFSFGFG